MKIKGWLGLLGVILILGVSMSEEAELFGLGGMSWKEEVLLARWKENSGGTIPKLRRTA